jgi:hypothetical protein
MFDFIFSGQILVSQYQPATVYFINGYNNCCTQDMFLVRNTLKTRAIPIQDLAWNNYLGSTQLPEKNAQELFPSRLAQIINNSSKNQKIILIGYSLGGYSLLQTLPMIEREIDLVVTLDPVPLSLERDSLKAILIPSKVKTYINLWQNQSFPPIDYEKSGEISCNAQACIQKQIQFPADYDPKSFEPHRKLPSYKEVEEIILPYL